MDMHSALNILQQVNICSLDCRLSLYWEELEGISHVSVLTKIPHEMTIIQSSLKYDQSCAHVEGQYNND